MDEQEKTCAQIAEENGMTEEAIAELSNGKGEDEDE